MVSSLARGNLVKCFVALFLGLLLATVGQDVVSGAARLTWGTVELVDGVGFIPAVVGMFGMAEVIHDLVNPSKFIETPTSKIRIRDVFLTKDDFIRTYGSMFRGGILGFFVGILPGAGATIASFLSYGLEQRAVEDT